MRKEKMKKREKGTKNVGKLQTDTVALKDKFEDRSVSVEYILVFRLSREQVGFNFLKDREILFLLQNRKSVHRK